MADGDFSVTLLWLSQQNSVPAQTGSTELPPEKMDRNWSLNDTLSLSWLVGLYSHNWAQANAFRSVTCPHMNPLKCLVGGKSI